MTVEDQTCNGCARAVSNCECARRPVVDSLQLEDVHGAIAQDPAAATGTAVIPVGGFVTAPVGGYVVGEHPSPFLARHVMHPCHQLPLPLVGGHGGTDPGYSGDDLCAESARRIEHTGLVSYASRFGNALRYIRQP